MSIAKTKSMIKSWITPLFTASDQQIQEMLIQSDVLSFDIFDTLVKRNVWHTWDIHELVGKKFYKKTGIEIRDYVKLRLDAEKLARKKKDAEEVHLKDIFNQLYKISEEHKSLLQKLEEETEIENCVPNGKLKVIYENAVQRHKHVIITSDMYLDKVIIERILEKCGYVGYERLYLSSAYMACKSTGTLFDVIKRDYADHAERIFHIGDSVKGDYMIPRKKGIKALLINGTVKNLRYWKKRNWRVNDVLLYKRLTAFLNNHIDEYCSPEERIGYEILGPILYGYCMWLQRSIEREKVERLFFLSREGKLLQEAYQIVFPDSMILHKYLYVSRQALTIPLLAGAESMDDIIRILSCFLKFPHLREIGEICDMDPSDFQRKLKEIELDGNVKLHEIPEDKKRQVFDIIIQLKKTECIRQREMIEEYLAENEFRGKIAISDIGWEGTMQAALQQYTEEESTEISGYYLGSRNLRKDKDYSHLRREGYLFSSCHNEEINLAVRFTSNILEFFFMNADGSVQKYKREQKINPVFRIAEYADEENTFIEVVQKSALEFVKQASKGLYIEEIPPDIAFIPYKAWAVNPSMKTLRAFEKICFLNGVTRKILPSHSALYYITHFRQFKEEMNKSGCKIFFLKKIFKLKLPYFMILRLMLRLGIQSEYQKEYIGNK